MSDDYLWDRSGPADPEVKNLEDLLGPLGHQPTAQKFPMPARVLRFPEWLSAKHVWSVAAAALLMLGGAGAIALNLWTRTWSVTPLDGVPQVSGQNVAESAEMRAGTSLTTDEHSRARVRIGLIGYVDVEPNSRLSILATNFADHRLSLDRGKIRARIWAPPKLFYVQTPSALAVDLGCIYTLEVDDAGAGALRVQRGWVAFEEKGRESFVPEGAMCVTRPVLGPGTPVYQDASPALQNALQKMDFELAGAQGGISDGVEGRKSKRAEALNIVLGEARPQDALTLWHLLSRTTAEEQARVYDRLAALAPPPAGVTREGVLGGDREMRDRWWNALGLRSTSWWRFWKGPVPSPE